MNTLLRWAAPLAIGFAASRAIVRQIRQISLVGKVVVITGGSRGLGLLMARRFGDEGATVVLLARDREELNRAVEDLHSRGINALSKVCDVSDRSQVERTMSEVAEQYGTIDVLVNNAGIIEVGPVEAMTLEDYEETMGVHFWGALFCTMSVTDLMRVNGGGRIINICSIGAKISVPHLLPYSASKFALAGFSEGLRAELQRDNILVTTVCPGLMRTGSHVNAYFKGQNKLEYAWFSISNGLPLISVSGESAAKQIVAACKRGDAELIIGLPAQILSKVNGVVPGLTADILSLVNIVLPKFGGIGRFKVKGKDSRSALSPSILTKLVDDATLVNNEA